MTAFLPICCRQPANTDTKQRQLGLTLVELMVAMTISLILLAAISQVFFTSRQTYTIEESQARTQEAGRFAMEFLSQDIRMAGYSGCASKLTASTPDGSGNCATGTVCSIADPGDLLVTFNPDGIRGHAYTGTGGTALGDWTPALPGEYFTAGAVRANTDVIIIQRGSTLDTHLTGNTTPDNANVKILNTATVASQITAGDILMVSDCKNADIFRANSTSLGSGIKTITHSAGNSQVNLTHYYGNDAQIMELISRAYFIGTGTSGEPALFRAELSKDAGDNPIAVSQELVEGVEDMRLSFGEETEAVASRDFVPNRFVRANAVTTWGLVVAVRVGLVTRTSSNVAPEVSLAAPLSFDGINFLVPTDRRRRQYYLATIQKRN